MAAAAQALIYKKKPVTLIEFDEGDRISQVWAGDTMLDFYWSKDHGVHLADHCNGGDQPCRRYWSSLLDSEVHPSDKARRIENLPLATSIIQEWLNDCWECDGSPAYCQVCDDHFADGEEHECRHLVWCDRWGSLSGCGETGNLNLDQSYQKPMFGVFRWMGLSSVLGLREAMLNHSYRLEPETCMIAHCETLFFRGKVNPFHQTQPPTFGDHYSSGISASDHPLIEPAIAWFKSLEPGKTTEGDIQVVKWIDQWLARKKGFTS